jgi:predicted unusual protein kinase regulating ubiquinone biosynthesis (AarF/ABC1/UbiB family)
MIEIPLEQPYSPEFVEAQLREAGFFRATWRILQITGVVLIGLLWRCIDRWSWTYRRDETIQDRQRHRAEWLLGRLIWLGPAFVKTGQSLGTRPDLLPLVYVQVLATLHDRLPPFPSELAFDLVEEELGWQPDTLFEQFDPEPCAAASLGQVYHAITFEGEEVAVKIQRPDLVHIISLDLALLRRLAGLLERIPRVSRGQPLVSLVDEFGTKLFEELDYVHEAHLTDRFGANFEAMAGIDAPRVYWELSSRRVLTTEYINGIKVTDREAMETAGVDILALLQQGVRANLKSLFEHGLFHADPHPGNLLVRPEDGTLVFIDFGMMGIMSRDQQQRLVEIFVDVINQRPDNLRENLIALGFLRSDARWDELVPLAMDLFKSLFGTADRLHTFQDVTNSFAPLLHQYEFRIPVNFAYIVRAIMTLEGISLQLDPSFDIWAVSAPYAARMMLTIPNPSLRQRLLDELLTTDGDLDWQRLQDLTALASHDTAFRLETVGLVEPALDMLLSPEGAALRRALVADLLRAPEASAGHMQGLAPILSADPSLSGRAILDRLIGFLLSPEGTETRSQLASGLRTNGSFDPVRIMDIAGFARRLHPEFRTSTLIRALGGYLFSEQGKAVREDLLTSGVQRLMAGLTNALNRMSRPSPHPQEATALSESE